MPKVGFQAPLCSNQQPLRLLPKALATGEEHREVVCGLNRLRVRLAEDLAAAPEHLAVRPPCLLPLTAVVQEHREVVLGAEGVLVPRAQGLPPRSEGAPEERLGLSQPASVGEEHRKLVVVAQRRRRGRPAGLLRGRPRPAQHLFRPLRLPAAGQRGRQVHGELQRRRVVQPERLLVPPDDVAVRPHHRLGRHPLLGRKCLQQQHRCTQRLRVPRAEHGLPPLEEAAAQAHALLRTAVVVGAGAALLQHLHETLHTIQGAVVAGTERLDAASQDFAEQVLCLHKLPAVLQEERQVVRGVERVGMVLPELLPAPPRRAPVKQQCLLGLSRVVEEDRHVVCRAQRVQVVLPQLPLEAREHAPQEAAHLLVILARLLQREGQVACSAQRLEAVAAVPLLRRGQVAAGAGEGHLRIAGTAGGRRPASNRSAWVAVKSGLLFQMQPLGCGVARAPGCRRVASGASTHRCAS
mmetsp:Transcript_60312/g.166946  ORF Transcript_60312/g.166946 Transcript_60312/m.166946 type:complete len:466 (-) Transcript_60312:746-2143(-)